MDYDWIHVRGVARVLHYSLVGWLSSICHSSSELQFRDEIVDELN
jgi:hypothetical protein